MTPEQFANGLAEFGMTTPEFRAMARVHSNTTWNWLNGRTTIPGCVDLLFASWRENKALRKRVSEALDGVTGDD